MLALSVTDLVPRSTVNVALESFLPSIVTVPNSLSVAFGSVSVPLAIVTRSFALSPVTLIVPSVARPSLESFVSVVLAGLSPFLGVWVVIVTPFSVIFVLLSPEPVSTEVRLTRFFANLMVKVSVPLDTTPILLSDNFSAMAFLRSSAVAFSFKPKSTPPTIFVFWLNLRANVFLSESFSLATPSALSPSKNSGDCNVFCKSATVTAELSKALSFSARAFSAFTSSSLGSYPREVFNCSSVFTVASKSNTFFTKMLLPDSLVGLPFLSMPLIALLSAVFAPLPTSPLNAEARLLNRVGLLSFGLTRLFCKPTALFGAVACTVNSVAFGLGTPFTTSSALYHLSPILVLSLISVLLYHLPSI